MRGELGAWCFPKNVQRLVLGPLSFTTLFVQYITLSMLEDICLLIVVEVIIMSVRRIGSFM